MKYFVISLKRSSRRLASFYSANGNRERIEHFEAIDGRDLKQDELIERGLAERELDTYSKGALGCALSHKALWERAVELDEPVTIFEDDAVLHGDFFARSDALLATGSWDYVQWGWNFDSHLTFMLPGNVSPCVTQFSQDQMREEIDGFRAATSGHQLFRLLALFGIPAYSITPSAADKLLDWCFPLAPADVYFWGIDRNYPNNGIDIVMNLFFREAAASPQVVFPPLVVTPNDRQASTIQADN